MNDNKIPACGDVPDDGVCERYYSFISFAELTPEEVKQLPASHVIKLRVGGKITCFDVTELFMYLQANPKASVFKTAFGDCTLSDSQKRRIFAQGSYLANQQQTSLTATGTAVPQQQEDAARRQHQELVQNIIHVAELTGVPMYMVTTLLNGEPLMNNDLALPVRPETRDALVEVAQQWPDFATGDGLPVLIPQAPGLYTYEPWPGVKAVLTNDPNIVNTHLEMISDTYPPQWGITFVYFNDDDRDQPYVSSLWAVHATSGKPFEVVNQFDPKFMDYDAIVRYAKGGKYENARPYLRSNNITGQKSWQDTVKTMIEEGWWVLVKEPHAHGLLLLPINNNATISRIHDSSTLDQFLSLPRSFVLRNLIEGVAFSYSIPDNFPISEAIHAYNRGANPLQMGEQYRRHGPFSLDDFRMMAGVQGMVRYVTPNPAHLNPFFFDHIQL